MVIIYLSRGEEEPIWKGRAYTPKLGHAQRRRASSLV
jgi:hypothetical protein